ncbi:uncharacterized protein Fot_06708 [Forsythia ovata]|uniref:Uncharacterized protein n=1 Tax=Forsythia ovata TaxID=205694 RepID=A0ABD1WTU4_9LAMI
MEMTSLNPGMKKYVKWYLSDIEKHLICVTISNKVAEDREHDSLREIETDANNVVDDDQCYMLTKINGGVETRDANNEEGFVQSDGDGGNDNVDGNFVDWDSFNIIQDIPQKNKTFEVNLPSKMRINNVDFSAHD